MQNKELNNLSSKELGKLFPIILSKPKTNWKNIFEKEKKLIFSILKEIEIIRIEHIGSTAIPNILSKPTIDILLEIDKSAEKQKLIHLLKQADYQCIPRKNKPPLHMMFAKGYSINGIKGKTFHIHTRYEGNHNELYFRDFLIKNPKKAKKYEKLKISLAKKYKFDREKYTNSKTNFVENINQLTKKTMSNQKKRYDAHCHLFSRNIVTARLIFKALEAISDYKAGIRLQSGKGKISTFLKIFKNFKDGEEVFDALKKSYPEESRVEKYIPLMVDFKFCFQEDYKQSKEKTLKRIEKEFKNIKKVIKEIDTTEFKAKSPHLELHSLIQNHLDVSFESLISFTKRGFDLQLKELEKLEEEYSDRIYPFLAVDPRRDGIFKLIKEKVGVGKTFSGLKLYAPLGYSPSDPTLFGEGKTKIAPDGNISIYQYCIDNNIPIIAHNSSAGFSNLVQELEVKGYIMPKNRITENTKPVYKNGKITFDTNIIKSGFTPSVEERAARLNHPYLWKIVLEKYPDLKIDLAHFGGDSDTWRKDIYDLMTARKKGKLLYPNLHTDLSSITSKKRLRVIKEHYYDIAPKDVQLKFMYGSDFYLNIMFLEMNEKQTDSISVSKEMIEYFNNFKSIFSEDQLDEISIHNPEAFLNITDKVIS